MKLLHDTITKLTLPTPYAVGDVHVYVLKGDTLSLVDAGVRTKEAWEALVYQLKQIGYQPNDIEQHILTHHHPDHIGLVGEFPRAKEIAGHLYNDVWLTRDQSYFDTYTKFFKDLLMESGVPERFVKQLDKLTTPLQYIGEGKLTIPLAEGDALPGHDEWQVMETKGHAQSHLSFFRKADGAFIGGDHLLKHISPNPILEPPHEGETVRPKPMLQYRSSLQKCLHSGIQIVYPGHGDMITKVDELISGRLDKQEKRAAKVLNIIEEKEMTAYEICQRLFPHKYIEELDLTMSETIGQLDFLLQTEKIEQSAKNDIYFYRKI